MKFGAIPVAEAENAILAHSLRLDALTLKKGQVVTPARRQALSGDDLPLLERQRVEAQPMRDDRVFGLSQRDRAEFHNAAPPPRSGFLRSAAMISPMIETAISAGLTAPMSRPIGA